MVLVVNLIMALASTYVIVINHGANALKTSLEANLIKSQVIELWFVTTALGNALAVFVGRQANVGNIATLPDLFYINICGFYPSLQSSYSCLKNLFTKCYIRKQNEYL